MEKIVINHRPDDISNFLSMEDGIYKNIIYSRDICYREFVESDLVKTDEGKIYYGFNIYKIKKGKKYYLKIKSKKGFTVDEKGKLNIWYGSDLVSNPHFANAFKALKIDWFSNEEDILWPYITKSIFEKVIKGKITNPIDYFSEYLKLSRIKASPKLMYSVCKELRIHKIKFLREANSAKDVNHYLEYLLETNKSKKDHLNDSIFPRNTFYHLDDLITQSRILDRKIDYKWSAKRMEDEHNKWTSEIMKIEMDTVPDKEVSVNLYEKLSDYLPEFFTPLDTQKKAFIEGSEMKHCIYTNYWRSIDTGEYLAYHVRWKDENATLGLSVKSSSPKLNLTFSQLYGKRNTPVSKELRDLVLSTLSKLKDKINFGNEFAI